MSLHRVYYISAVIIMALLYLFYMKPDGYRLPRYYTPNGSIVPVGESAGEGRSKVFLEIAGISPSEAPAVFPLKDPVIVTTERSTGLMAKIPNSVTLLLLDFKYFIFYSFLFVILAIWFVEYGNDYHLSLMSLVLAGFLYTSFASFAFHELTFFWQFFGIAAIPVIFNMGLRTTGKEIPGYLFLAELIFLVFLSLIAFVGQENAETFSNMVKATRYLFFIVLIITILIQLENATRSTDDSIENMKRWALVLGTTVGLLIPSLIIAGPAGKWVKTSSDPLLIPFILSLSFPAGLAYGTYRIYTVPFQFTLSKSIIATILTVLLVFLYGIVLLTHSYLLPEQDTEHQWIANLIFILILVFFLDPARRELSLFLEKKVFRLDQELTESLERLANIISSPNRIQSAINDFLEELRGMLNVESVNILFSDSTFSDLKLKQGQIIRIPDNSKIWKLFAPEKIIVTAYLTYGAGSRGDLYRFLVRNKIYLGIGISGGRFDSSLGGLYSLLLSLISRLGLIGNTDQNDSKIHSAFLLGYRPREAKFRLSEIRYLQEASRIASLLIDNYFLLIQELEKRRRVRQLLIAGEIQESMSQLDPESMEYLKIIYFNLPVISVTGDYVDIMSLPDGKSAIFLGDISGHGLGTGYLVAAVRAIIRDHMRKSMPLSTAVINVNRFLIERYKGSEFASLVAMIFNPADHSLEFINAGHPAPIIIRQNGSLEYLDSTAGLLGVKATGFYPGISSLHPEDRLFLYSDGVTETMNRHDHTFGLVRLTEILKDPALELEEIPYILKTSLELFRDNSPVEDDTSFIAISFDEYNANVHRIMQFE